MVTIACNGRFELKKYNDRKVDRSFRFLEGKDIDIKPGDKSSFTYLRRIFDFLSHFQSVYEEDLNLEERETLAGHQLNII
jgi:hypothetical protein